ncbi:hypothetical protein [Methylobacterium indicum]|uniref:Uncharacterized protein n=1 Tax=Methylobacterium indicum TaxID=1775910 RepID=A0A8H8X1L2_9HYPH|nr:hypothetical protein [Methylobacterium indicum]BCM87867.1 hypothetical protein mvi_63280 [Methylobacterium indicum]
MTQRGPLYTPEELERAVLMKAKGMRWKEVAEALGRPVESLKMTVSRYRRGFVSTTRLRWREERALIEREVWAGKRPCQIAREQGWNPTNLSDRMIRMGLDLEVRNEIYDHIKRAA